jgi:hypothetical protein
MMIAIWMKHSVTPPVIDSRLYSSPIPSPGSPNDFKLAGAIQRVMPRSATGRSRKGMKGGES